MAKFANATARSSRVILVSALNRFPPIRAREALARLGTIPFRVFAWALGKDGSYKNPEPQVHVKRLAILADPRGLSDTPARRWNLLPSSPTTAERKLSKGRSSHAVVKADDTVDTSLLIEVRSV